MNKITFDYLDNYGQKTTLVASQENPTYLGLADCSLMLKITNNSFIALKNNGITSAANLAELALKFILRGLENQNAPNLLAPISAFAFELKLAKVLKTLTVERPQNIGLKDVLEVINKYCDDIEGTYFITNQKHYVSDIAVYINTVSKLITIVTYIDSFYQYPVFEFQFDELSFFINFLKSITNN